MSHKQAKKIRQSNPNYSENKKEWKRNELIRYKLEQEQAKEVTIVRRSVGRKDKKVSAPEILDPSVVGQVVESHGIESESGGAVDKDIDI